MVEFADLLRRCALLWSVHGGRALRPGQRVVDVAGEDDADPGHPLAQPGELDARDPGEPGATLRYGYPVGVQQECAEPCEEPGAPVGACRAADAQDHGATTRSESRRHHLTDAPARRAHRGE